MRDWLIALVMPPKRGASEEQLYAWRLTVGIAIILLCASVFGHMAWSVGAYPFEGEGFVQKSEFQQLAQDTRRARLNALRTAIMSTVRESCDASGPYKALLAEQLTDLLIEWEDLNGKRFPTPACNQVQ